MVLIRGVLGADATCLTQKGAVLLWASGAILLAVIRAAPGASDAAAAQTHAIQDLARVRDRRLALAEIHFERRRSDADFGANSTFEHGDLLNTAGWIGPLANAERRKNSISNDGRRHKDFVRRHAAHCAN